MVEKGAGFVESHPFFYYYLCVNDSMIVEPKIYS